MRWIVNINFRKYIIFIDDGNDYNDVMMGIRTMILLWICRLMMYYDYGVDDDVEIWYVNMDNH